MSTDAFGRFWDEIGQLLDARYRLGDRGRTMIVLHEEEKLEEQELQCSRWQERTLVSVTANGYRFLHQQRFPAGRTGDESSPSFWTHWDDMPREPNIHLTPAELRRFVEVIVRYAYGEQFVEVPIV